MWKNCSPMVYRRASTVETICAWCFRDMRVYPSGLGKNNYCSLACRNAAMAERNRHSNPHLMTPETRAKLRARRLNTGAGRGYEKTYGRHTHRVIAEQILGRALRPGEVVHHIDGNKRNNAPENLMIFPSQKEHAAYHAALRR